MSKDLGTGYFSDSDKDNSVTATHSSALAEEQLQSIQLVSYFNDLRINHLDHNASICQRFSVSTVCVQAEQSDRACRAHAKNREALSAHPLSHC
jgi:hypothetical protein